MVWPLGCVGTGPGGALFNFVSGRVLDTVTNAAQNYTSGYNMMFSCIILHTNLHIYWSNTGKNPRNHWKTLRRIATMHPCIPPA